MAYSKSQCKLPQKDLFAHFWFKINHCMMPFWAFFHSNSTCCLLYFRGIVVPNHDSPMGSYGNNVVSIGRVTSFGNWATFSFALGDQRTLLVSPDLEKKIRKNNLQTSWNKKITYSLHMRITYVFGLRIQIHAMCIVFSSSSKSRSRLYS